MNNLNTDNVSSNRDSLTTVMIVAGPTASGKSTLAARLCKKFSGEIVNADAVQMYSGLDIATNKPSEEELSQARHHLVGILAPGETTYNARQFSQEADAVIKDIISRGKVPVIVGGTNYYLQKLLVQPFDDDGNVVASDIDNGSSDEKKKRKREEGGEGPLSSTSTSTSTSNGSVDGGKGASKISGGDADGDIADAALLIENEEEDPHDVLARLDPEMARRWHRNDRRRILNSIAIIKRTGRPHSEILREAQASNEVRPRYRACLFCLLPVDSIKAKAAGEGPKLVEIPDDVKGEEKIRLREERRKAMLELVRRPSGDAVSVRVKKMVELGIAEEVLSFFAEHDPRAAHRKGSSTSTSTSSASSTSSSSSLPSSADEIAQPVVDLERSAENDVRRVGTVLEAIGYREFIPWCLSLSADEAVDVSEAVKSPLFAEALSLLETTTRRYARKQVAWVRNKLLPCAGPDTWDAYVFDSTAVLDRDSFESNVIDPAMPLAEAFLNRNPAPVNIAKAHAPAAFVNASVTNSVLGSSFDKWGEKYCDVCDRTLHGEREWKEHITTKKHKKKKAALARRRASEDERQRQRQHISQAKEQEEKQ